MLAVSHQFDEQSVKLCQNEFPAFHRIGLKPYTDYPPPWGEIKRKWDMHWPFSCGMAADPAGQKRFAELAGEHDGVWFHTLGAAFPFRTQKLPRSVMDLDDLNHHKYDLRAQHDTNVRFRCSAKVQAMKWKRHEFGALQHYEIVVVCSEHDAQYLGASNVRVIPNGFTPPPKESVRMPDPHRLGFIGTLGYGPNYEGLVWFRDRVWPHIRRRQPAMELRIVGSPPPPRYHVEAPGFTHVGYVPDPADEMSTWSAMVVPILYGGGTRIKILEAFSKRCPVVSTPLGARGIRATDQKDIRLADDPRRFIDACLDLAAHPEEAARLAEAGYALFEENYTWDKIGAAVRKIIDELKILNKSAAT
jgi:glycosyltransferase involved in cell wall biosynthesis